jgi:hypothetical protein
MSRRKYSFDEVLCYTPERHRSSLVPAYYLAWRRMHNLPYRCYEPECPLHTSEPEWNKQPLKLIVDHISGNSADSVPGNLRLVCPNCDSQNNKTRGGRNIGRIVPRSETAYEARNRDGTQDGYVHSKPFVASASLVPGTAIGSKSPRRRGTASGSPDGGA